MKRISYVSLMLFGVMCCFLRIQAKSFLGGVYNGSPYTIRFSTNEGDTHPNAMATRNAFGGKELKSNEAWEFKSPLPMVPWKEGGKALDWSIVAQFQGVDISYKVQEYYDRTTGKIFGQSKVAINGLSKGQTFYKNYSVSKEPIFLLVFDYQGVPDLIALAGLGDLTNKIDQAKTQFQKQLKDVAAQKEAEEKRKAEAVETKRKEEARLAEQKKQAEAAEMAKRKQEEEQRKADADRKAKEAREEAERVKAEMERRKKEEEEARKKAEESAQKAREAAEKLGKELEKEKGEQAKEALLKKINDGAQVAFEKLKKSEHRKTILDSDDAEKRMEQGLIESERKKYMHVDERIKRATDRYHRIVRLLADEGITWAPIPEVLEAVSQPMPPALPPVAVSTPAPKAPTGLLGDIQKGGPLKKVSETSVEKPGKSGLLEDIRKGKPLRKVTEEEKQKMPEAGKGDLRRHLEEGLAKHRAGIEPEESEEEKRAAEEWK